MAAVSAGLHSVSFVSSSIFGCSPLSRRCRVAATTNSEVKPVGVRCQAAPPAIPVLSFGGEKVGEAVLELRAAPPETARAVVHRGLVTDMRNKRRGTASTLTRGEVRGGGRKPYPQKKTGRARRGSTRTPLRPGGGVVFGPKPKDWSVKMNRKEKRLALSTAIASAADNDSAVVVEDFAAEFGRPATKEFISAMKRWGLDPKEKAMFLFGEEEELGQNVLLSGRNIGTVKMLTPRTLNLFDVLDAEKLVFTKSAVAYLNRMYGVNVEDDGEDDEEEASEYEEDGDENAPN